MPIYVKQSCSTTKKVFTTKAGVPTWSRPMTNDRMFGHTLYNNDNNIVDDQLQELATTKLWNRARPIKHWRKQLMPVEVSGNSRNSMTIQTTPGSSVIISNDCCAEGQGSIIHYDIPKTPYSADSHLATLRGKERRNICNRCEPTNDASLSNNSGVKDAKIQKFNFDTKAYLRSRNKSFASNQSGAMKPSITYSKSGKCCSVPIPYSDDNVSGTQNRDSFVYPPKTIDNENACSNKPVTIIVKPNNQQFFQQGAVSSSSRLHRLKYNTVTANANGFSTAWGAAASSAGKYRADGNSPYFIKSKNNICSKNDYRRHWRSLTC